jgi:phosphatidylglycerol:prolipoprotein diacylglycerol transferase
MYPELIKIGPAAIRSYGVMLVISFFLGLLYVYRISKRDKLDFNPLVTIAYIMVITGLLGSRIAYVLFHIGEFQGNWLDTINPFHSDRFGIAGLNLYGGILIAVICTFIYLKVKRMPVLGTFDIFAPTVGLGLIFTRVGCFLNGCCFGTPTELPWGISFPENSMPYYVFGSAPLHPAQLYSSLYGLILFIFLHWRLKNRLFPGQVLALLFMIEAVFRFAIEYVRYYEDAMHIHFLGMTPTYNHLISVFLFALGLVIYIVQHKRYRAGSRKKS